jgi:type II secretory pathway pseudopilin PulG
MKLFQTNSRAGYALLMVMMIVGIAALVAGSTLQRTYTVSSLNQRSKQYQAAMYAAEASVEKVYARFRADYLTGGDAAISNSLALGYYQNAVPTSSENSHWANFQFWNAQGVNNQNYVAMTSNKVYQVLDGPYTGLSGWRGLYRVVSNARPLQGINAASAGVQQEIAVDTIPAFQFAIFYNGQLEFTWCAPLTVRGRTHANGPICLGPSSSSSLTFLGTVTTTSSILKSNLGGYSSGSMTGPVTYNGTPKNTTKVPTLQLPIGENNTPAAVREILYMPQSSDSASMASQRYHNKAAVVVLVSNATISLTVKDLDELTGTTTNLTYDSSSPTLAQQTNLVRVMPFLSLTNTFTDYREGKRVKASQVNMGILKNWLVTNSMILARYNPVAGPYPNIMYVGDFRTASTNLYAVRVMNGSIIPTNGPAHAQASGFTLATPNPIYVWGHYNTPNASHLGTTNTSATFPASLVGDALTVLSPNWADSTYGTSTTTLSSRGAANTTVNAAIIAGAVYSTGTATGQWSGGVHNLPRLLEDWPGRTLTLNTSLVNLYNSVKASTQFQNPGIYYNAPTRAFNFDQNFLQAAKLPPGTPTVSFLFRSKWTTTPVNTVTYNGP